jgi:aminoglycoside phosphotransferase (APT) family kinase protein
MSGRTSPRDLESTQAARIVEVLRTDLGAASIDLLSARRLSAGASRLSWELVVRVDGGEQRLVLQRERVPGSGRLDVETEAGLIRAARTCGVPAPRVVVADRNADLIGGAYLITDYVQGETLPHRIQRDPALRSARECFSSECGRILAQLQTIRPDDVTGLDASDPIERIEAMLDTAYDPHPTFELGLNWLRRNRPQPIEPVVVHGDFRLGNPMMQPDGIAAVLDWELAHLGAPLEDLSWICVRAWRWGGREFVGGIGRWSDLVDSYTRHSSRAVDEKEAYWWRLLGTVRWGVFCHEQARTHLSRESRSPELALLGRRAVEIEYDVLALLP